MASYRILVIDDNPSIHTDLDRVFESEAASTVGEAERVFFGEPAPPTVVAEYELAHAMQGQDGLDLLLAAKQAGREFDVAFVDMRMPPGWDGVETILQLWEADPFLEVIICSAYSDYSWRGIVEKLGLSDRYLIIRKPFDNIEVLQAAASLGRKRHLNRENADYRSSLEKKVRDQTLTLEETLRRLAESNSC